MTRNRWARDFIDAIGAKHCDPNAWALISWMQAEGGTAQWNPFNTTQKMPGSWDYNWVGVQNYPSFEVGLEATVKTIKQTHEALGYVPILNRLRACARARRTLRAVEKSAWGTGGLALQVLPYVKADYWRYANHTIPGVVIYRCSNCGISWPPHKDYKQCGVCEEETHVRDKGTSITLKEARSMANNARFERFYAEYDAKREGPTPEELGAAQAKAIRELEAAYGEKTTTVAELDEG